MDRQYQDDDHQFSLNESLDSLNSAEIKWFLPDPNLIKDAKVKTRSKILKYIEKCINKSSQSFTNVLIEALPEPIWITKREYLNRFIESKHISNKNVIKLIEDFLDNGNLQRIDDFYGDNPYYQKIQFVSDVFSSPTGKISAFEWMLDGNGENPKQLNRMISRCLDLNCPLVTLEAIYLTSKLCRCHHFLIRGDFEMILRKALLIIDKMAESHPNHGNNLGSNLDSSFIANPSLPALKRIGFNIGILYNTLNLALVDWVYNMPSASIILYLAKGINAFQDNTRSSLLLVLKAIIDNFDIMQNNAFEWTKDFKAQQTHYKEKLWRKLPLKIVARLWPLLTESLLCREIIFTLTQKFSNLSKNLPRFESLMELDQYKHNSFAEVQKQFLRTNQLKSEKTFAIGQKIETTDSDSETAESMASLFEYITNKMNN